MPVTITSYPALKLWKCLHVSDVEILFCYVHQVNVYIDTATSIYILLDVIMSPKNDQNNIQTHFIRLSRKFNLLKADHL